jgi:penicillin-binding protein 1A
MVRLLRLIAVIAAAAVVFSGTIVAFAVISGAAAHKVASAQELPLPPINSKLQEPSTVLANDGKTVLATLSGPEFRQPVALSQVSKTMITAVLDTEDHGFYIHGGFDVPSIVRAFVNDAQGQGLQGGSTIPQQLVKQLYLSSVRTLNRKIREAVLADRLEQKYSRDQILQAYLNTIYLGSGAYGVQAAARTYFGEPATALNLAQSALLAGMIQDPNGYDPILQPAAARERRTQVLQRMIHYGDITAAQAAAAEARPLPSVIATEATPTVVEQDPVAGYYVNQVKQFLLDGSTLLGPTYADRYAALFGGGLRIVTNLDPTMQAEAEQAVAKDTPANSQGFEEGLVSIDPTTGAVRALVGGTGAQVQQFDVMTQGQRQPGSGFKLFTLLAALQQGYSPYDTVDGQGPCEILFPGNTSMVQTPIRNDDPNEGVQSIVTATANSVNCAFVRLGHEVGLHNVISMAQSLGVSAQEIPHSTFDYIPSVVIGSAAVKPIEMAGAYAAVADDGVFHAPSFVATVSDRTGNVIYQGLDPGHRVFSTQVAAEADVALNAVVTSGTGTAAAIYNRPVAGKTGTTNNNVDAWFNGFTPQLETTVWIGNLHGEVPIFLPLYAGGPPQPVYGANFPAETWHDYSSAALTSAPVLQFPAVANGLLPPTRFVTSNSLVHDDVVDHNAGSYANSGSGQYNNYNNGYSGTQTNTSPATTYPPPVTTPATKPSHSPHSNGTTNTTGGNG